jgi:hypothetical protein
LDSGEGIKTQVWMVLIANLIFTVIHKRVKEGEQVHNISVHGKSQPDLLYLLPDHPKNQLPGSRGAKSGNSTIGYL